ncbi:uncharacterized protein BDV14DRAFT_204621 [Aspergillus stella-maris]|uniref:uncharacterized protein n=1 Tax=Aspergillus stella-maris TaxID=1810926 RepID=UPI003CCE0E7D
MANQEPQCPRCREFGHTHGTCPKYQWAMKRTEELRSNQNCKEFKELRKRMKELIVSFIPFFPSSLTAKGSKKVVDEQVRQEERDQRRKRLRERQQEHLDRDPRHCLGNHNVQQRTQDSSTSETPTTEPEQSIDPTAQQDLTHRPAPSTSQPQPQEIPSPSTEQTPVLTLDQTPTTTPSPGLSLPNWSTPSTPQLNNPPPQPTTWRANWHFSNGTPPPRHYDAIVGGYPAWYEPYVPPVPGEDYNFTPSSSSRTPTHWERKYRDEERERERERRSASPSPEERGSRGRRRAYRR